MDDQGLSNHEMKVESRNETWKQSKVFAHAICVFVTWMIIFSHMDEIGSTLWAIYFCAVLPIMRMTISINTCLIKIIIGVIIRAIIGWFTCTISLTIARIPEIVLVLSVREMNGFVNRVIKWINEGASIWREINKYPPNTRHLRPVGTRVGFYGERITFGGKSSLPRNKQLCDRHYLGFYALKVLSMFHDLALLHATCIDIGWPIMYLGATGLLYLLVGSYAQVKSLVQRSMSIISYPFTVMNNFFHGCDLNFEGDCSSSCDSKFGGDHGSNDRRHQSPPGCDSVPEGDCSRSCDSVPEGDHGKTTSRKCSVHLTLDGTSIFNQWITAVSVDDVRKQIHDRFARALKRRELKFAPTRFLLSGKTRGRMRFLTPDEEIYDGMRIIISPVGRGGMKRKEGLKLPETPSPDKVPPPNFSLIPRPGTSFAQRTTVASDSESQTRNVRFTNVTELESQLKSAQDRAESEANRASLIERQLDEMNEKVKRLTEENEDREKTPTKRALEFGLSPKNGDTNEEVTAKVFLGHNPPPLDSLGDVSDKQLTERIEAVTDWLESLRAWIQDTVSHGDILYEALKDAAEEYYQRWLNLTADPFRLSEINLESILDGSDTLDLQYYDEFLLRSFGKISKALPKRLSSELKKDIAANKLTAFQKVASILAIVLTSFSVTNLKEHTALFGALHQPSQWLYGTHIKDGPTGYVSLVSYIQALEFAKRLPRVSQLDIGRLTTGVTTLVTEMMSLLDGLQRDELSARARQNGLFVYGCKLDSLIAIIKMCRDVARVSASFKKNFKERSDKKDKDKKEREKREETNKRKRGNLAKATPEQSPSEHPVNTDQPTPSTAHQAKAKGKGQKGAKGTKGSGKNDEQKQTEQGTTGNGKAQGESNQDTQKPSPKLCSVCGKTLAEHPDKKWCVPLCYECKKPLDAHPNRRWCPRTKNGQSPSAPAGSPTPP